MRIHQRQRCDPNGEADAVRTLHEDGANGSDVPPHTGSRRNEELLAMLARAAPAEDAGLGIGASVERVIASDMLQEHGIGALVDDLVTLAEVNLPVARLIEGHVNALHLIRRLGGTEQDGLYGVWGADGAEPCTVEHGVLKGRKRFASGLGVVRNAIVSVRDDEGTRLAIVPADDPARHDEAAWSMTGMRATVSGEFDLAGLTPEWLGPPDAWFEEPSFIGGVWRIAALQLGGVFGLIGAVRNHIAGIGRLDADAQIARLAPLIGRALAARGLVLRAAEVAEGEEGRHDPERSVALSASARLLTEDIAQDAVKSAERSVGLAHFDAGSETGRLARDLSTYCRQVARDALEQKAGRIILGRSGRLSEFWHG